MSQKEDRSSFAAVPRLPLALVITLFIQGIGIVIWAAQLDARVSEVEHNHMEQKTVREQLARLEERMDGMKQDTSDIKLQLNRIIERIWRK